MGINEKFIRDYIIDDTEVKIELDLEKETNKVILDMSFLKEGLKQTIITSELEEDLKILIPNEVGEDDIFEENLLYAVIILLLSCVAAFCISASCCWMAKPAALMLPWFLLNKGSGKETVKPK